ncbi:MAG TPA: fumarylacetoacetate hydrolase family protein [Vicinamibacterales bacterium]|jgi:2-keto-4-pentenoate hydratase
MNASAANAAASLLWRHWTGATRLPALPIECRPETRADGYAIQRALASLSGQPIVGYKIAATSAAGQRHIGVDGPLAGTLLADRVLDSGASISIEGNAMRVAEAEFAFRIGRALPPRGRSHDISQDEVLDAVDALCPTIEIPDSRYEDFARVGAPQLIADAACAWFLVVGAPARVDWRALDLAAHTVATFLNGAPAASGAGSNVLGDPRIALTWVANELCRFGEGLREGDLVTTGTCIPPVAIAPGDSFRVDFGVLGTCSVRT